MVWSPVWINVLQTIVWLPFKSHAQSSFDKSVLLSNPHSKMVGFCFGLAIPTLVWYTTLNWQTLWGLIFSNPHHFFRWKMHYVFDSGHFFLPALLFGPFVVIVIGIPPSLPSLLLNSKRADCELNFKWPPPPPPHIFCGFPQHCSLKGFTTWLDVLRDDNFFILS